MPRPKTPRAKKPPKPRTPWTVVRDTSEKEGHGWWWDEDPETGCQGTVMRSLDTGDYSLVGYESVLTIERKRNTGEFAQNVTQARFDRELDRLDDFPLPFLILEFTGDDLSNFPANSGVPHNRWRYLRTTPDFLWKKYVEYDCTRKVKILLAGKDGGKEAAERIFRWVVRNLTPKPTSPTADSPSPILIPEEPKSARPTPPDKRASSRP